MNPEFGSANAETGAGEIGERVQEIIGPAGDPALANLQAEAVKRDQDHDQEQSLGAGGPEAGPKQESQDQIHSRMGPFIRAGKGGQRRNGFAGQEGKNPDQDGPTPGRGPAARRKTRGPIIVCICQSPRAAGFPGSPAIFPCCPR